MKQIGEPIRRRFVCIDEGKAAISLYDTGEKKTDTAPIWVVDLQEYPLCRALQRIGPDHILVGYDRGFLELELGSGHITKVCNRWEGVTAAYRQENGHTLIAGLELSSPGMVQVISLDSDLSVLETASREGDYVRLMSPTQESTYLLCVNDQILETTEDLASYRDFRTPGFLHAWQAQRLQDGSTLVSAGYGAFMANFSADRRLIRRFGGIYEVPAEVKPHFYASFRIAKDGHILVANWAGHGPDNGQTGRQLLEFDAQGKFIGSWSDQKRISSFQGLLLIE